jgi:hypothetical protein
MLLLLNLTESASVYIEDGIRKQYVKNVPIHMKFHMNFILHIINLHARTRPARYQQQKEEAQCELDLNKSVSDV